MADPGPWDDTDHHDIPRSSRTHRSLRVSHLDHRSPRRKYTSSRRSVVDDDDVEEKVNDLTSSLRATSEVLSTADRMLDHYRCINGDQDEEIKRLRSELDRSTELMQERRSRSQNRPRSQPDVRTSLRDLESEQQRLTREISRDREERARLDVDNRRTVRRLEESFQRVEDDLRDSFSERRMLRDDDDVITRREARALLKKRADAERELLSDSVKLTLEKEREIKELREQLRESQRHSHDQELESKVRRIYDEERSAAKEKKEVGKLIEELKSVKNLMNETSSEKKMKQQLKRIKSEEDEIERSERERRLFKQLQTLDEKLEDCEREKRKVEQDLQSAVKRLEWSEGGRSTILKQMDELNNELKATSEEKTIISASLRDCKAKLEESELLRDRLTSRIDSLYKKYENEEQERDTLIQQIERLNDKIRERTRELEERTKYAKEQELIAKESETNKEELKNRALETIKEYKIKCKKYEKDLERCKNDADDAKEELRKIKRHTDEGSSRCLALEKELREVASDRDRLKNELDKRLREADDEIKSTKKRLNSALDENLSAEEKLASVRDENIKLKERTQMIERRSQDETSRLNQEIMELKDGIRDVLNKKSRLDTKLKDEQCLREELVNSLDEAKEEQAKAKEEVASLYRQLQRERNDCNISVKDVQDKMQKIREQSMEEVREYQNRLQKQKDEFDEKLSEIKLQLADEKATVKALRKQQEKDGVDIENLRSQLTRFKEENIKLRQKHDDVQRETETKQEMRGKDKARISELETEIRRCHHSLSRVTDEQKDGFDKVNEAIDELIEKFCEETSISRPSTLSGRSSIDPKNWASETAAKLKWLEDEINGRLQSENGYRDRLNSYQGKMKDVLNKADTEKAYFVSELDKQNVTLKELARAKKDLEEKERENEETIALLQKKIAKLTKHLDTATKALQASISALEEKQKVVDEFDSLRGDQEERERMRTKYVRYQERVGSLKRELNDAKTQAKERKQDTEDASNLSARLLESLNRLSSPHLCEKHANETSTSSSRSKPREEFGLTDFLSFSGEGGTRLNEDHNFKTPDRVSVGDLEDKKSSRALIHKSSHFKAEQD